MWPHSGVLSPCGGLTDSPDKRAGLGTACTDNPCANLGEEMRLFRPLWSKTNFLYGCPLTISCISSIFSSQVGFKCVCVCVCVCVCRTVDDFPFTHSSLSLVSGFLSWFKLCWGLWFTEPEPGNYSSQGYCSPWARVSQPQVSGLLFIAGQGQATTGLRATAHYGPGPGKHRSQGYC